MMSICMPCVAAANLDLQGLVSAGNDTKTLAAETTDLCVSTRERGEMVVSFGQEIKTTLSELVGNKMNPAAFMSIKDLLNDEKMKGTLDLAQEMDGLAIQCADKSTAMKDAMQRGVDSMPDMIKDTEDADESEDTEGDDEMDLGEFENDIAELEECTEGLRSMNLLTAATKGQRAFEGLSNKGVACDNLFGKIKDLCATVGRLCETFLMDNCCAQIQAGIASLKDMKRCLSLSDLIGSLAALGRRLIESFIALIKVAWEKFSHFLEEFQASKKLKNFMNGLNPLKNTAAGNFLQGAADVVIGTAPSEGSVPEGRSSALCFN